MQFQGKYAFRGKKDCDKESRKELKSDDQKVAKAKTAGSVWCLVRQSPKKQFALTLAAKSAKTPKAPVVSRHCWQTQRNSLLCSQTSVS